MLLDAQIAANEAGISLPNYAMVLVPRFKYSEGGDDRPFPHQFKIFFDPSASRTRGVRIGRVGAILDATTNGANAMAKDSQDWPKGDPIGIQLDVDELTEEDCRILAAYSTFKLPVIGQLPAGAILPPFSREEARDVLIGKVLGKSVPNTLIPDTSPGFDPNSGVDDDALLYLIIAPDHDEHNLNADGEAKTRGQRQEEADYAFMNEVHEQREENVRTEEDPVPPYEPMQLDTEGTFATSSLQVSLTEPASNPQTLSSTPVSATASMPSSEAPSATSSNPDVSTSHPRKSTVAAR